MTNWLKDFHDAGFTDLWYAHPGDRSPSTYGHWFAGMWTGPDNDLICVRLANTPGEAERYLSPCAHTPELATQAAIKKLDKLEGS